MQTNFKTIHMYSYLKIMTVQNTEDLAKSDGVAIF